MYGVPTSAVPSPGGEQAPRGDRPEIYFEKWDRAPDPGIGITAGQAGFFLANDGIAAHGVSIESFRIGGKVVNGEVISRIEAKGRGFMLVWIEGHPPGFPEKWDLIGAMTAESNRLGCGDIHSAPYSIEIVATYRDSRNNRYRSRSRFSYSAGPRTVTFGPTTIEQNEVVSRGDVGPRPAVAETTVQVNSTPPLTPGSLVSEENSRGNGAPLDFASEAGRSSALSFYTESWSCSGASLARTAAVHAADLTKWKAGTLPSESVKKYRIENALKRNDPPTPAPKRSPRD
jgi:hypothetical protein